LGLAVVQITCELHLS